MRWIVLRSINEKDEINYSLTSKKKAETSNESENANDDFDVDKRAKEIEKKEEKLKRKEKELKIREKEIKAKEFEHSAVKTYTNHELYKKALGRVEHIPFEHISKIMSGDVKA